MATKILVAGASGNLGRAILAELQQQGYTTRALVRDAARLGAQRQYAGEVFTADARDVQKLSGVAAGVSVVISALGASLHLGPTRDGATFQTVDYEANRNLLREAQAAGVAKFVYVSMCGVEKMRGIAYVEAHEAFVAELQSSGMDYTIVRPTGFFYLFEEIWKMAQRGVMLLMGDGSVRTNPIHEDDLARFCVASISSAERERPVGGPDIMTRREIAELAAHSNGKTVRFIQTPAGVMRALLRPVALFDRKLYELMDFGVYVNTVEIVAPAYGTHHLADYFAELSFTRK